MGTSRDAGVEMQDYMINWNVGPLGLVLRPDLGADMPPVVSQVLPGESVASLAGVSVGDMLVSINGKKASKLGYEKAMKLLYKQKLPMILHFRIPQFKTMGHDGFYQQQQQQQTPTSLTPSGHTGHHHHGGAYHASSFVAPSPHTAAPPSQSPYPGQFVQYNQQQHQQQYQQPPPYPYQQQQPPYHDQQGYLSRSQRPPATGSMATANGGGSTRGLRSLSVLSASTATKEQKLKKQFSVVWESGSLGFSFRPYAPGVNIPTVDLIGARGDGKNMDQVFVNDVLIAINGENTKSLGVERVLKMLHVLEKPVVLRFHKSSHRIENPPAAAAAARQRRRSAAKLPAVAEKEQDVDEDAEVEEDEPGMVGVMEEEGMPSVRFADEIQLRSEQRDDEVLPPPPPPPPPQHAVTPPSTPEPTSKRYSSRVNLRLDEADTVPASPVPMLVASKFAARTAPAPAAPSSSRGQPHHHRHVQEHHASTMRTHQSMHAVLPPPPPPPPAVASPRIPLNQPVLFPPEQDLDDFPEPDQDPESVSDVDESKLPPVPITVVGSVPQKRASSSFVIPLEHAREIVAKSSGKPVEMCEFGGLPLPQIREGSVQARLLVTFAKACLAKQMKQLRDEGNGPAAKPREQPEAPQQPTATHTPPRSSSPHSSENRSSIANAGSTYVPSNASTFAGNSLGPGKPKFPGYSLHQSQQLGDEFLHSQVMAESGTPDSQRGTGLRGTAITNASSIGYASDSAEFARLSEDIQHRPAGRTTDPNGSRNTPPQPATLPRSSDSDRPSNGGLTMSQLRTSDKLSSLDSKLSSVESDPDLRGMLKDLNSLTPPDNTDALPKRMTEMISLDALLVEEETKDDPSASPEAPAPVSPVKEAKEVIPSSSLEEQQQLQAKLELAGVVPAKEPVEAVVANEATTRATIELPAAPADPAVDVRRKLSTPAYADHPVIQNLCVGSRDLELVMIGRDVDMILCKKEVVEEIQDILDSLEMELQFERHSHVGFGHGSIVDEPPVRCCSRCGKNGDLADLALDSERRELYCQNCWDVFFYHKSGGLGSPRSSRGRLVPPEVDTPTDFDPFEYSLHDSMVNVADDFHPWRHLNFDDSSSERDSNMTQASSITSHADEVWL